mmetsp:Transcript_24177/g.77620  ORF Transcript_24177/g.77620 Transcript_24177/m.77620 type:complete len:206 (+) Transcript_24177:628-1245(+)
MASAASTPPTVGVVASGADAGGGSLGRSETNWPGWSTGGRGDAGNGFFAPRIECRFWSAAAPSGRGPGGALEDEASAPPLESVPPPGTRGLWGASPALESGLGGGPEGLEGFEGPVPPSGASYLPPGPAEGPDAEGSGHLPSPPVPSSPLPPLPDAMPLGGWAGGGGVPLSLPSASSPPSPCPSSFCSCAWMVNASTSVPRRSVE